MKFYCNKLIRKGHTLYPMNAPKAVGTGNTMNLPKSVTYFGRLTILPKKK